MEVVTMLKQVDLFRGLDNSQLELVGQITVQEDFNDGDVIFEQGDHAGKMYIVSEGQVEIIVEHSDGQQNPVVFLGTGQIIGEMTLVDEGKRSATVKASGEMTRLYSILNTKFVELCRSNTDIGYMIMRNIAQDMSFKLRHRGFEAKDS